MPRLAHLQGAPAVGQSRPVVLRLDKAAESEAELRVECRGAEPAACRVKVAAGEASSAAFAVTPLAAEFALTVYRGDDVLFADTVAAAPAMAVELALEAGGELGSILLEGAALPTLRELRERVAELPGAPAEYAFLSLASGGRPGACPEDKEGVIRVDDCLARSEDDDGGVEWPNRGLRVPLLARESPRELKEQMAARFGPVLKVARGPARGEATVVFLDAGAFAAAAAESGGEAQARTVRLLPRLLLRPVPPTDRLRSAAVAGDVAALEALAGAGEGDPNARDACGRSAMHYAALLRHGAAEALAPLLALGGDPAQGALALAAQAGRTASVRALLGAMEAEAAAAAKRAVDADGRRPVDLALLEFPRDLALARLLQDPGAPASPVAEGLLFEAAGSDDAERVAALLAAPALASPDARLETFDRTPLMEAADAGALAACEALDAAGADLCAADRGGSTIAHAAAAHAHMDVLAWAVGRQPRLARARDRRGNTPLQARLLRGRAGPPALLELLLPLVDKPDAPASNGMTLLQLAAAHGAGALLATLLELGCDVNAVTDCAAEPKTALLLAVQKGRVDLVEALVAAGARVDDARVRSPVAVCLSRGADAAMLRALVAGAGASVDGALREAYQLLDRPEDVDDEVLALLAPLHERLFVYGAAHGNRRVAARLPRDAVAGVVDCADPWGFTPLHRAALMGDFECVAFLLSRGASAGRAVGGPGGAAWMAELLLPPDVPEGSGQGTGGAHTALTLAAAACFAELRVLPREDFVEVSQRLLAAGADAAVVEPASGLSPLQLFAAAEVPRAIPALLRAGASPHALPGQADALDPLTTVMAGFRMTLPPQKRDEMRAVMRQLVQAGASPGFALHNLDARRGLPLAIAADLVILCRVHGSVAMRLADVVGEFIGGDEVGGKAAPMGYGWK